MDQHRERRQFERSHDPGRVMAPTDGVFAIVITLLVLEIHVPELSRGQRLTEVLHEVRPSFHRVPDQLPHHRDLVDGASRSLRARPLDGRNLMWLNLLYMLPLSLLPFGPR
jgi:uncharacterized membrane protein